MAGRRRTRKETGTLPSGEIAQLNVTIRRCLRPQPEFKDVNALVTTLVRALKSGSDPSGEPAFDLDAALAAVLGQMDEA